MKLFILLILLLVSCSSCLEASHAEDLKNNIKPSDIKVEVGKVTEVVFPEKVSKVIKGGQTDSVLIEVLENSVYLLPKIETPPDIFVTTISGISYPLTLHITEDRDIKIQIGSFKNLSTSSRNIYGDVMDLMKELLLNKEPAMATVIKETGQTYLSNKQVQLTVDKAYDLGNWKAYILNARNLINNAVIIPIEQISMPNLLAISSDRDMLSAKGQLGDSTKVYIVTGQ